MFTKEETKQVKVLQGLLRARLNVTSTVPQTVSYTFGELMGAQLFTDRLSLERILDLIKIKTNTAISWKVRTGMGRFIATTAAAGAYEGMPVQKEVGVDIHVADARRLAQYFKLVFSTPSEKPRKDKMRVTLFIEQKNDGEYYCKGKLIKFPNPSALYAQFFRAVFELGDSSGFVSSKDINPRLRWKEKSPPTKTKAIQQRIRNAKLNLFRHVKGLPKKTPRGEPLIKLKRGEGVIFNNPEL